MGNASPSNYQITLNGNATLRNIVRRTDPVTLPTVGAPTAPSGTVNLSINAANQAINWVTLRNLTLNSSAGYYTVPAGSYGQFTANNSNGFILGVAGATQPAIYNFQSLTFNSGTQLRVVGPVIVNVATGPSLNGGSFGASAQPSWFTLKVQTGNVSLNGSSTLYGSLVAPASTVTLNGNSLLNGTLVCDRLTINGNSTLRLVAPATGNQAPSVSLTAPASGSSFPAPASITLAATATDSDGSIAKVEFFQGAVSLGVDTVAPFALTLNVVGAGSYSYYARATDNLGASSDSATVTVTVTNPNVPPTVSLTAPADGSSVSAPATLTLAASAADFDGTIAKVEFYQGTTKLGEDATAPYQQVTGSLAAGTYEFSAKAFDNGGASTGSTVITITVVTPNQPPVVSITAPVDGSSFDDPGTFILKATASDPNGTVTKVEFFKEGVLLGEDTTAPYEFTVSGVAIGSYDFVARATDNAGSATDSTAVRLTVAHVNDAPTAASQSVVTPEDSPITITLTGVDPDGDAISFIRTSDPSNGTLTPVSTTVFTYTPAPNFNGTDSFTFKTKDVTLESAPATVQITVTPRNDPPIAVPPPPITVPENGSVAILLGAADIDSPSLSFGITANVSHGTLSGSIPNLIYTPVANYNGSDSLMYVVSDGEFFSAPAVVSITVTPVNYAPQTSNLAIETFANAPIQFTLSGTDNDGDPLIFAVNPPANGTITLTAAPATFTFTPALNYSGPDSATFTVSDGIAPPVNGTVSITVKNRAPIANNAAITVTEDTPTQITLSATDPDGQPLTYIVTSVQHGTLTPTASPTVYTYSPAANYALNDSFTFKANDGYADSNLATVAISITPVNDAPETSNLAIETFAKASIQFTLSGTDADGDVLTYTVSGAQHGSFTQSGASDSFTYFPEATYAGPDNATFTVSDGIAPPVTGILSITVKNRAPIAYSTSESASEDTPAQITLSASDPDGQSLNYSVTQPAHGTLSPSADNGVFTYTPNANFHGDDVFTFKVSDGIEDSAPATVQITVASIIDLPVAIAPPTLTTPEETPLTITLSGSDVESLGPVVVELYSMPKRGTLIPTETAGTFIYTPEYNFDGQDSFVFGVHNDEFYSDSVTVGITVVSTNQAPTVTSAAVSVYESSVASVVLGATDPDGDPLTLTVI